MDRDDITTGWAKLCSDGFAFSLSRVGSSSEKAREMMLAELVKFTYSVGSVDSDDHKIQRLRFSCLTSIKIRGIHSGDLMARSYPRFSHQIFNEVERLCALAFPINEGELDAQFLISSDVSKKISEICSSDR
jgi:hypothetical protein